MEKISHIVRGNARISSADVKSSSAVRPGALSFGREVGNSTGPNDPPGTTASRAAALQNHMMEQRQSASDKEKSIQAMSDGFFMSRIRRPDEHLEAKSLKNGEALAHAQSAKAEAMDEDTSTADAELGEEPPLQSQPQGYKPRGSYVDVRA